MHGRNRVALAWLIFATITAACSAAAQPSTDQVIRTRVEALLEKAPRGVSVGVAVINAASGEPIVAANADTPLKPASVLKLFTTAAALLHLGPDFEYETPVFSRGDEMWVIGSGDPAIADERVAARHGRPADAFLQACGSAARGKDVRRIVLDDSIFDQQLRHPSWPEDQNQAWYQAPIGGLNYNDNCLDARISLARGEVSIMLTPPLPTEFWSNALRTGSQHRPVLRRDADSDVFEFSGTVTKGGPIGPIAVNRPTVFIGHAVRAAVESATGAAGLDVVRRSLSTADVAAAGSPAFVERTRIRDVIWRANTFSQNLFAESLIKSLSAYEAGGRRSGRSGNWGDGSQVLKQSLARVGVDLRSAQIVDGSGLSHDNRVTASQVATLLRIMHRHPLAASFAESLAEAGEEGTLRRKRDAIFAGRLRAKTGTLRDVHALAGYATRTDGTILAFAVLVNGGSGDLTSQVARELLR